MRWLRILGLLFFLASCGFHLRGLIDMPEWLNNVAIIIPDANRGLAAVLEKQLAAYQVKINPEPAKARYWLIIERDQFEQQIVSVSSSTTPRQFQLIYTVWFKVLTVKGPEVIPTRQVQVTRQLTINSNRILGSDDEARILKGEMQREAAMQILNRLSRH